MPSLEKTSDPTAIASGLQTGISMPFGATVLEDGQGVLFQLWAPSARRVTLEVDGQTHALTPDSSGWYRHHDANARHGSLYQYRINDELNVPDPASRFQPQGVHGPSQVIDPTRFHWKDDWKGRPWEEVILYELHVGTFTKEGTFSALLDKLDYLVDLGITAIELMPIAAFPGTRNWGYDGVLPFSPADCYGTPDSLKMLIQAAHQKGLMVFLDVVYNHFGPEDNYLHAYAQSFFTENYQTPWGAAINFETEPPVRDFFVWNALYWLKEYQFDGLRFDAVHAIQDHSTIHFLDELASRIRAGISPDRHIHLVLENDDNSTRFLGQKTQFSKQNTHANPEFNKPSLLFNAQWNDDFHHAAHVLLTQETTGYYADYVQKTSHMGSIEHLARCLTEGFAYQGEPSYHRDQARRGDKSDQLPPTAFVNFLQNHDQIGNRALGERLGKLAKPQAIRAALTVLLLAPAIPLLFMGEEWQSQQPFLFFCDFGPELAPLVTEGRRQAFAKFPEFSNPETQNKIPDPSTLSTYEASRLDWGGLAQEQSTPMVGFCRQLIALRKASVIPALLNRAQSASENMKSGYEILGETAALVWWHFPDNETRVLLMNLGERPLTLPAFKHHNFLNLGNAVLLFESETAVFDDVLTGRLPEWSAVWLRQ